MDPAEHSIDNTPEQQEYPPLTLTFDDVPWSACRHTLSLLQPATFTRLASHFSRLTREFFKQQPQPKSQPTPPPSEPESSAPTPGSTPPESAPEPLVTFTRSDFKAYLVALHDAFKYTPGIWKQFLQITIDFIAAHNPSSAPPTPSPA
ncbi:MAG: hypothetical protein IT168_04965 [Bryobacterales bacterium]|nr:hypothetical protein [Bryobacterales bacterium]